MKNMYNKKFILFCVLSFVIMTVVFCQNSEPDINYVLLIDKTGSMVGRSTKKVNGKQIPNIDIWNDVQESIIKFIGTLPLGNDKLTIYTFAGQPSNPKIFDLSTSRTKNNAIEFVNNIRPDGLTTGIYNALDRAFKDMKKLDNEATIIYLFTDGVNEVGNLTMDDIVDQFNAKKAEEDHCYFIQLTGDIDIPPDIVSVSEQNNGIDVKHVKDISGFNIISLKPKFKESTINLANLKGKNFHFDQRFELATDSIIPVNCLVSIEYDQTKCNLDWSDQVNITNQKCLIEFEFLNDLTIMNNDEIIDIAIKLTPFIKDNLCIRLEPNTFILHLVKDNGTVNIKDNGWK